ncbi:MAG: response regulator [Kiritimatiellia bacterium]|nr:response regulator [Kiritimatiellia bacterium]
MNAKIKNKENSAVNPVPSIMIVEDEAIVAKDIETSLIGLGYSICAVVSSGEEALVTARDAKPDLILMDIMLKGEIDGIETAKRITSHLDIPVIFLTAFSDESTIGRAKETNASGYLLKPFEERELRSTIEMALYKNTMERRLKQNRERLETILRSIADGVLTTNVDGLIEFCNPVAECLTGWPLAEMTRHRLSEVVCLKKKKDMSPVEVNPQLIIRNGSSLSPEGALVLIGRDGRQTEVEYNAAPLMHLDEKILGVVFVLRDVAARQKGLAREQTLQRRLFRAQRMESLGLLANGVAKQLLRIIEPMVDYPRLILDKTTLGEDIKQDFAMIQNSAQKATEILTNLITLGQMKDYSMNPLNLNEIIEDIANSPDFKTRRQTFPLIEFQFELAHQSPPITGCRQNLRELINNLVSSAYSFITESGLVELSTEFIKLNEPVHGFEIIEAGEYVVLKVKNTGPEMNEEEINRFFEPFAGKSAAGHYQQGLGPAVAYAIIKGHKGMIDVKSSHGKGTEVIVYFPAYTGPTQLVEQSDDIDVQGVETILVVDDDQELRKTTMGYLRSIGYKVIGARNGSEAVELVKKTAQGQGQGQAIDLVIIDMIMADDFDGLDTYKTILQFNPRQKAITASGFSITDRVKNAMEIGVGQHILKPYEHEDLAKAVRKELDKPARKAQEDR